MYRTNYTTIVRDKKSVLRLQQECKVLRSWLKATYADWVDRPVPVPSCISKPSDMLDESTLAGVAALWIHTSALDAAVARGKSPARIMAAIFDSALHHVDLFDVKHGMAFARSDLSTRIGEARYAVTDMLCYGAVGGVESVNLVIPLRHEDSTLGAVKALAEYLEVSCVIYSRWLEPSYYVAYSKDRPKGPFKTLEAAQGWAHRKAAASNP